MSIRNKIYAGFGIILALLVFLSVFNYLQVKKTDEDYKEMLDYRVAQSELADDIQIAMALQGLYIRSYILKGDQNSLDEMEMQQKNLSDSVSKISLLAQSDLMKGLIEQITLNSSLFNENVAEIVTLKKAGDYESALRLLEDEVQPAHEQIQSASNEMVTYQAEKLALAKKQVAKDTDRTILTLIALSIISIILGIVISSIISRIISRPLRALADAATFISQGDLSEPDIEVKTKDELRELGNAFNSMKHNLRDLVTNVNDSALHVTASAEQLSASTHEVSLASEDIGKRIEIISNGAQVSAASAKESSVAMEETATGLHRIAESTQSLNSNAVDTMQIAESSEQAINEAKNQMGIIYDSSFKTSELVKRLAKQSVEIENITKVITDITEQTNLLALNAAIEAARAGEHGKGFAVVADEVRKLAEESKKSANKIVELIIEIQADTKNVEEAIQYSLTNVEKGVLSIEGTGKSFFAIVSAVQNMTKQIEDISAATEEISASAEEVSASVIEISSQATSASEQTEMTSAAMEEQMATVHEINDVAYDLSKKALDLQKLIQQFRV